MRWMIYIGNKRIDQAYPGPTNPSGKTNLGIRLIWTPWISRQLLEVEPLSAEAVEHRVKTFWKAYREQLRRLIDDRYSGPDPSVGAFDVGDA